MTTATLTKGLMVACAVLGALLVRGRPKYGDPLAAFDYVTVAIRNLHDSGSTANIRSPLAVLAALFDRLGRYEPAATIAGFSLSPSRAQACPRSALPSLTCAMSSVTRRTRRSPARVRP